MFYYLHHVLHWGRFKLQLSCKNTDHRPFSEQTRFPFAQLFYVSRYKQGFSRFRVVLLDEPIKDWPISTLISETIISIKLYNYRLQMSRILSQSAKYAQQGRISDAINTLKSELERNGESYGILSNLAALYLQIGDVQKSIQTNSKAISLDPFAYVAYYNRFICYFVLQKFQLACGDLQKALSCLYLLKGYEQNNLKMLNKAISYCQQNARAYLIRAKLHQGRSNKLAENDYTIAIEYAPNLGEIYQQRALFYRKIGKVKQFEENFAIYFNLKSIGAKHTTELVQNQLNDDFNYKSRIAEGSKQFQQLLTKRKAKEATATVNAQEQIISKLPLDSVQSSICKKEEEQLLLSDRDVDTAKTIEIRKQEINFKKRDFQQRFNKNFQEIFQDQTSKELNQEIQRLESEIKAEGGKISHQNNQQLDVSDPSNFLTVEIQKAIEQITKLSNRDLLNDVKSVRSAKSSTSVKSHQSENKELTIEQFKSFRQMELEIVSLQDLDNPSKKQVSKVVIKYRDREYQTAMSKFEWRQKFKIPIDSESFEADIKVIQKGGVFKPSTIIGEGLINFLDPTQSKCILGSKDKKTAILYYKLQLFE